jgi:hypothetical protein
MHTAVATEAVYQVRELGFENSKIGSEYGRWKNKEEGGFFTLIIVKIRPTWPIRHGNQQTP